jgi:hypothetical protein
MAHEFKTPSNGAEWEKVIWEYVRVNPNVTARKLAQSLPGLPITSAHGFLNKLSKRSQVAGVSFLDVETGRDCLHYSISTPDYVATSRKRNRRVSPPRPEFNFDHEDGPIKLITDTVSANANVAFDPEAFTATLSLSQGRELYNYLETIYGARK